MTGCATVDRVVVVKQVPPGKVGEQGNVNAHEEGVGAAAAQGFGRRRRLDNRVAAAQAQCARLLRAGDGRSGLIQLRRRAAGDKRDDDDRLQHCSSRGRRLGPIKQRREIAEAVLVTVFDTLEGGIGNISLDLSDVSDDQAVQDGLRA